MKLTLSLEQNIRVINDKNLTEKLLTVINVQRNTEFLLTDYHLHIEGNEIIVTENKLKASKVRLNQSKRFFGTKSLFEKKAFFSNQITSLPDKEKLDRIVKKSVDFILRNPNR